MENYRDEILDISSYSLLECEELTNLFNNKFPKKDAFMQLEGTSLHIMLSQLDMKKYYDPAYAEEVNKKREENKQAAKAEIQNEVDKEQNDW